MSKLNVLIISTSLKVSKSQSIRTEYCDCRLYDVKNAAHKDKFGEEMLRVDSGTEDSSGLTIQLG